MPDTGHFPHEVVDPLGQPGGPGGDAHRLYVTLGQFSLIRLERDTQLLIPVYDYCMPNKECTPTSENPCDLFHKMSFPVNEFFPPATEGDGGGGCGCGTGGHTGGQGKGC